MGSLRNIIFCLGVSAPIMALGAGGSEAQLNCHDMTGETSALISVTPDRLVMNDSRGSEVFLFYAGVGWHRIYRSMDGRQEMYVPRARQGEYVDLEWRSLDLTYTSYLQCFLAMGDID